MGCAPRRIWRPGSLDRGVWHVSLNTDTSNETHQGPPDGTQGYLAACYRNIVDTKPSHFSKSNPESDRKSNRKPKKPNGPSRKSNRLTKKQILRTFLPHWIITWADWCGAMFAFAANYGPFYKSNGASEIQFALHYSRPSEFALRKLCTNINQSYLIWAAVLCRHVSPTKNQGYWDQQSNRPRRR